MSQKLMKAISLLSPVATAVGLITSLTALTPTRTSVLHLSLVLMLGDEY